MSDSFSDLWSSSAPVKPSQPARKLGASPAPSSGPPRPKYDAFAMLAASASKTPSPRSLTPSTSATAAQKSNGGAVPSTSGDVFGDLLSGSFGVNPSNANLSIAEQAARANTRVTQQPPIPSQNTSAWVGLDSLAGGASFSSSLQPKPATPEVDDDWIFGSASSSAPKPPSDDDLGLGDFASGPKLSDETPLRSSKATSLLDLDDFNSVSDQDRHISSPAPNLPPSRSDTPGDFDFGDRENALLDDDSGSDDDILGDLGKPPREQPAARPSQLNASQAFRPPSPPPHLIGQIVEMGFSPGRARAALASTESGLDIQAALEALLSEPSRSSLAPAPAARRGSGGSRVVHDRFQDDDGWGIEEQKPELARQHPRQQTHPSRERPPPSSSEANYQQHADKLIAQASEISSHIFQRANAFWKEGKSRVSKAYEDRATSSRAGSIGNNEGPSGRPRWMQDLENDQVISPGEPSRPGFRDEEADSAPVPPSSTKARPRVKPSPPDQSRTVDLFSEDTPTAYVSPFRRGAGSRTAPIQAESPRPPSPVRLTQRNVISASPSAISASAEYKASGTDMFKLGRFAEAEAAYTSAISRLPDSHLLLVPLLNNRGLSRLRTGNMSGAIEDFTAVIALVGPSYHPAREAKVAREEDGAGVDLGDALGKAWRRRAEGYEGREKWDMARQDWESIVGADFAGRHRGEALNGISRCKKMLSVGDAPDISTSSTTRANASRPMKRPPPRRGPTPPSEAVVRLKQANQEAEAEEQARLELKDSVDSRLAAWKNGKETNLRALVASLDMVLWSELGWQKVGMAELVTPNQVKIRYTKAIAKLHPDKLNVKNTTLEQRMIANGVFGALNDAWNAFKP